MSPVRIDLSRGLWHGRPSFTPSGTGADTVPSAPSAAPAPTAAPRPPGGRRAPSSAGPVTGTPPPSFSREPLPAVRLHSGTVGRVASRAAIAWCDPGRAVVRESLASGRIWMVLLGYSAHRAPDVAQGVLKEVQLTLATPKTSASSCPARHRASPNTGSRPARLGRPISRVAAAAQRRCRGSADSTGCR